MRINKSIIKKIIFNKKNYFEIKFNYFNLIEYFYIMVLY